MISFLFIFSIFVFAHCLADYPLQGDFLARAKNRSAPIPGVPWLQAMGAHVAIHAGFVLIIAFEFSDPKLALTLAAIEAAVHFATDDSKCTGKIGFNTDQAIHIACKLAYACVILTLRA